MENDIYTGADVRDDVIAPAPEEESAEQTSPEGKKEKKRMPRFRCTVKAIDPKMIFVLFGIFTVVIAAIRAFQIMYLFEPDTGFFFIEKENSIAIPLLYTVAAVSVVIYFVLSHLSAKIPEGAPP